MRLITAAALRRLQFEFDPNQPRDERGRWTDTGAGDKPAGQEQKQDNEFVQWYSPNIEENTLTFEQALEKLRSHEQTRLREVSLDIDNSIGLHAQSEDAIGDWSDGAENSMKNVILDAKDFEDVRYSAALKGLIAKQKAVLVFGPNPGGKDAVYEFAMRGDMNIIRKDLDAAGIAFRTLVPKDNGAEVTVYDQGRQLTQNIGGLADRYGITIKQITGSGEYIGGDTREAGAAAYQRVIDQYESTHSRHYSAPAGRLGIAANRREDDATVLRVLRAKLRWAAIKAGGFDPSESRDDHGRWTKGGNSPADAGVIEEKKSDDKLDFKNGKYFMVPPEALAINNVSLSRDTYAARAKQVMEDVAKIPAIREMLDKNPLPQLDWITDLEMMKYTSSKTVLACYVPLGKRLCMGPGDIPYEPWVSGGKTDYSDLNGLRIVSSAYPTQRERDASLLLHELGHHFSFASAAAGDEAFTDAVDRRYERSVSNYDDGDEGEKPVSMYAATNPQEFFAESFAAYFMSPDKFKSDCPMAYELVDDFVANFRRHGA